VAVMHAQSVHADDTWEVCGEIKNERKRASGRANNTRRARARTREIKVRGNGSENERGRDKAICERERARDGEG